METKKSRWFWFWLICLIAVCIFIHMPFLLTRYFGEPDAARIANDAYRSVIHGEFKRIVSAFSTPLYTYTIYTLYKTHLLTLSDIPCFMSTLSLIANVIVSAGLFIFIFQLTASLWPAVCTAFFLQFNSVFWLNSIYGFPTILALAICILAVICFNFALTLKKRFYASFLFGICSVLFICAVLTKVDTIFLVPLFCLPIWIMDYSVPKKIHWTFLLCAIAGSVFIIFNHIATPLSFHTTAISKWKSWNTTFCIDFHYLISKENRSILIHSFGFFTLPVCIAGIIILIRTTRLRTILLWFMMCVIPLVFFWGLRDGNSGRHNLIPIVFLFCIIGLPALTRFRYLWIILLCIMTIANYFIYPPSAETVCPSGNIVSSSSMLIKKYIRIHKIGKKILRIHSNKIAVVGNSPAHPSIIYEILKLREKHTIKYNYSRNNYSRATQLVLRYKKHLKIIVLFNLFPPSQKIIQYVKHNFVFVTLWKPAFKKIQNELQPRGTEYINHTQIIPLSKLMKKTKKKHKEMK